MYRDKRGVSQIITTIIIVLISLVAALAVWQLVENYLPSDDGTGTVDCFKISMDISSATCTSGTATAAGSVNVTLTRAGDSVDDGILIVKATKADGSSVDSNTAPMPTLGSLGAATAGVTLPAEAITSTTITTGLTLGETTCTGPTKTITCT